ncbi:hypothetical protein [Phytohabitans houttuyneae]|uniref:Alkaline shock response membrane anchor protein AmaP n=1 Tax=Phytohabitans houttuyneae TaxID=1076126 RepID=A0A6V8KR07_9ACTN|nr:hypothetical protein [Phytohabitans houttuyneae]GFJ86274.1 hypothetical protein Phou_104540 [Phytohabitans houttuyneae]
MTNAANRTLWTIIGVLLLAAGVAGILAYYNRFFGVTLPSAVLWPAFVDWWRDIDPWGPIIVIAAGLLVAWLGLLLLRAELRTTGQRPLPDLHTDEPLGTDADDAVGGRTTVRADALVRALRSDLARQHGIHAAKVKIGGTPTVPRLAVRLDLPADTQMTRVRETVDAAVTRFTTTSGLQLTSTEVTSRITDASPRVR